MNYSSKKGIFSTKSIQSIILWALLGGGWAMAAQPAQQPADSAATLQDCAAKQHAIELELQQARQHGSSARVRGLERARDQARKHCRDDQLAVERQRAVAKQQAKVRERQQDLQRALDEHKGADQIAKRRAKLQQAEHELEQAKAERLQ